MNIQLSDKFSYSKLIIFTIPTIFMMIFTSIYGVVDGLFISNVVGSNAFAAVNFIMPALMIAGSIGFMIGTGGSALVSKTIGEGKCEEANQIFSMLIYFLIIVGFVITILGIIFIRPVAEMLGADSSIIDDCVVYGRILLVALIPFLLENSFQSFIVVAERPIMGLVISIAAGITNIILDFLLIYVFKMGIIGAGIATSISQTVGGIIPFVYFARKNKTQLRLVKTKFNKSSLIKSCINGSSEMMTNLSISLVDMMYNIQLMRLIGADGVVAYGIIMYISFIFIGVYLGYSIGVTPIIGYNYGAGNKEELQNIFKKSLILISIAAITLTGIAELLSRTFANIFVSYDKELLNMTTLAIRIFSISFLISGFNIFVSSLFTALNNGLISAVISFLRSIVFENLMIFLIPAILGVNGIWSAVIFAELFALIVSVICLIRNRSKYEYI